MHIWRDIHPQSIRRQTKGACPMQWGSFSHPGHCACHDMCLSNDTPFYNAMHWRDSKGIILTHQFSEKMLRRVIAGTTLLGTSFWFRWVIIKKMNGTTSCDLIALCLNPVSNWVRWLNVKILVFYQMNRTDIKSTVFLSKLKSIWFCVQKLDNLNFLRKTFKLSVMFVDAAQILTTITAMHCSSSSG